MKKINAKIIADSIDSRGNRITSYILTYPRMIHSELMTHRMFSRNAASSRAIPFKKMIESVQEDPFIPIAFQKDHKGMQGTEYITSQEEIKSATTEWLWAMKKSINSAKRLNLDNKVTKQLCNRLLEPFQWYTCLVTATEFDNFFELRCPKYQYYDMVTGNERFFSCKKDWLTHHDNKVLPKGLHLSKIPETIVEWLSINKSQAEIHIQSLAEAMWDARNESKPKLLKTGEWHIPFSDNINNGKLSSFTKNYDFSSVIHQMDRIKIATARCARLSYMTFDREIDYEKDIKLHDQLLESGHMSPFEHCAKAMSDEESAQFRLTTPLSNGYKTVKHSLGWCNNFRGFIQYRYLIE